MRHQKHKFKLSVSKSHRKSMIRNLGISFIEHGQIKTTVAKCNALQPYIEKMITISREDSVANRRLIYSKLNNRNAVNKLFTDVAPKFTTRPGGYTRIVRLADSRVGDGAELASISLVD